MTLEDLLHEPPERTRDDLDSGGVAVQSRSWPDVDDIRVGCEKYRHRTAPLNGLSQARRVVWRRRRSDLMCTPAAPDVHTGKLKVARVDRISWTREC
jgi:hypothetical protein